MPSSSRSLALLSLCLLTGCVWETELPADAAAIRVERGRELLVTDDAVLGELSSNTTAGPLGFRHAMERLPLHERAMLTWMRGWSARLRDEGDAARADALETKVTCPWLRRTPENGCNESCTSCSGEVLSLALAPYRLIAVANRTDLAIMPDRAAEGGEGRLVYALTDGAADDEAARPLPFTVVVEYAQHGSAAEWARRWHALGSVSDAAFPAALAGVTTFVEGGALAQVRTADAVTGPLVLHEFHLADGELVASDVRNTPRWATVPETEVRAFTRDHAEAVASGTYVLPRGWWAPSSVLRAEAPAYLADVAGHDALVRGTCGGCHESCARGFHVDPLARGDAKLSPFLLDQTGATLDELGRRAQAMQMTLARP